MTPTIALALTLLLQPKGVVQGTQHAAPAQSYAKDPVATAVPNQRVTPHVKQDGHTKEKDCACVPNDWTHSDWINVALALLTGGYLVVTYRIFKAARDGNAIAATANADSMRAAKDASDNATAALREAEKSNQLTKESLQMAHHTWDHF